MLAPTRNLNAESLHLWDSNYNSSIYSFYVLVNENPKETTDKSTNQKGKKGGANNYLQLKNNQSSNTILLSYTYFHQWEASNKKTGPPYTFKSSLDI